MKKYFVYMLLCADKSYYVGVTNDVLNREQEHNIGFDKKSYTYDRRPVTLVWYQEFVDASRAIAKEKQLKGWSREKKEALISGAESSLPELSRNTAKRRVDRLSVTHQIEQKLPYAKPFLFVDEILDVDENGIKGSYLFSEDAFFYKGHFKDNPVTPGVILTECCAQIGLVALGIYLLQMEEVSIGDHVQIGLSSSEMEFYEPVFPNEQVVVTSEKIYFRFHKLKCKVNMHNAAGVLVCKGTISGMLKSTNNG